MVCSALDLESCIKWDFTGPHYISLFLLPAAPSNNSKCSNVKVDKERLYKVR
jgi:hypothetical protein